MTGYGLRNFGSDAWKEDFISANTTQTDSYYLSSVENNYGGGIEEGNGNNTATDPTQAPVKDLVVNTPTKAVGRDRYYTTSTADMTLLMELRDSESGELLARIADRRTARSPHGSGLNRVYYSNPISNSQAVRSTFKRWATILVGQLDQLNTLEKDGS